MATKKVKIPHIKAPKAHKPKAVHIPKAKKAKLPKVHKPRAPHTPKLHKVKVHIPRLHMASTRQPRQPKG